MKVVIQRALASSVEVDNKLINKIEKGMVILVGVNVEDTSEDVDYLVRKTLNLRIFDDENGVMNKSILDVGGEILSISQFTLQASTKDGNRPSYINAMKGEEAVKLYEEYNKKLAERCKALKKSYDQWIKKPWTLNKGEEGVVLKKKDAVYVPDKRPAWSSIKIKKMDFIDCICIGFEDATKQYSGKELNTWEYWVDLSGNPYHGRYLDDNGYATIKTPMFPVTKPYFYGWKTSMRLGALDNEGKIVEIGTVSSGLTDDLKADFAKNPDKYLNRVVSIQCMEKNNTDHTLRHGFFKCFRDDKNFEDCLIDTIF